ncbi:PKD domain-containing protein [Plantibacter sp. Mn2098]|uniref:PKD domain-containing protein n=1 Tax=Plantibacter sp. Mn2098 TaxID=3395266 RepID=UPI003BC3F29B
MSRLLRSQKRTSATTPSRTLHARQPFALVLIGALFAAFITTVGLAQPALADTVPQGAGEPSTVSADALPTVQIDGVVWSQVVSGNTVYVAGNFTNARPAGNAPGVGNVARTYLLAYNLTTGVLINSFAPTINAQVKNLAVSPDGTKLYAVGNFTTVNGQNRYRIAAFDTATGNLTSFAPTLNYIGFSVAATNTTVYVGGGFTNANGAARIGAAAFSASNGGLLPWAPNAPGGPIRGLVISPDQSKIVIGGAFTSVNGSSNPGYGLAAVDATAGALLPWNVNNLIRNGGDEAAIYSLASDGDSVYGSGYVYGSGGNLEGAFRAGWANGDMNWVEDCHGDTYSVAPQGDSVYVAGHPHYCGNIGGFPQTNPWTFHNAIAFSKQATGTATTDPMGYYNFAGNPTPTLLNWFPDFTPGSFTGANQGPWSVAANSQYVVYGGEFTQVNNKAQQGLVRFAVKPIAPNLEGPMVKGGDYKINVVSLAAGTVRVAWKTNHDRDNELLKYELIRNNQTGSPIYTKSVRSTFWKISNLSYTDSGLTPGQTYNYRVKVTDPLGNSTISDNVPVTVAATGSTSPYSQAVLASNPTSYWPLGEASGTTAYDWATGDDLTLTANTTRGTAGAIIGSPATSTTFAGTSNSGASTTTPQAGPNTFTAETWIKTTTTSGGKILGFGNATTGNSGSYDRMIYMTNDGRLEFGVYPGGTRTVSSTTSFNDGSWHHVVATLGSNGMQLFVDGKKISARTDVTNGQDYTGYWRIGGDNLSGWPDSPSSFAFAGAIDDTAIYPTVLSRDDIIAHYVASGRVSPIPAAPADAYGASVYNLDPTAYWRLNETSGSAAADAGKNGNPGVYTSNVVQGGSGALVGVVGDKAPTFGQNGAGVASSTTFNNPTSYALEAWFKTTTHSGGKIVGFGSNQTGTSSSYDRHIYMENDGRLTFGTYTGQTNTISSSGTFNDGAWHQVVAMQSSGGMKLYVDGVLQGTNPQTSAQNYTGYWRVGGDTTWGGTASTFTGKIDEVAIYSAPLTDAQVQQHYSLGKGQVPNVAPTAGFTITNTDLTGHFDASSSVDSDGTIASYAWDFGDGSTGTGITADHAYAAGGTYTVTLTVTDNQGATGTLQHPITVVAPNVLPTASFTATPMNLSVQFDASASVDSDGTIASYAWDFGDGATGTGVNPVHVYATAGTFPVALTVTDNRGGIGQVTHQVVTTVPVNTPPVAAFTPTASGLTLTVDASASSDAEGPIASYAWNFGDGGTGSGVTAAHNYAASGTYAVVLTVTDGGGASTSLSQNVTVTAPPAATIQAKDTFARSVANGWGTADVGGPWAVDTASAYSVASGSGLISTPVGVTRTVKLSPTPATDTEVQARVSFDKSSTGGGNYASIMGRVVGADNYAARVWIRNNQGVQLQLMNGNTTLKAANIDGLTYLPGTQLQVRFQAVGTSPTQLKAKVWAIGSTEPAAWQLTATDTQASLQVAGTIMLRSYISGTSTDGTVVTRFGNLLAQPSSTATTPPANVPPTAAFVQSAAGLTLSVDGSTSSDPEGPIASYVWDFGDGATAAGATATHTYAAAGAYTVKLTVTDGAGATGTATKTATVTAPPPNVPPTSVFTASASDLAVSVDASGSADSDGTIASYAWDFGDGATGTGVTASHTYAAAGPYTITLTVTDNVGAATASTQQITVTAPVTPPVTPPATVIAGDAFERTAANGWGPADVGGAWTPTASPSSFSVSGGKGVVTAPVGQTRAALLNGISVTDADVQATLSFDQGPTGGGNYASVIGRQVGSASYAARIWIRSNSGVQLQLMQGGTTLKAVNIDGITYTPGQALHVRLQVKGVSPTTVQAKVWADGGTEPTAWQLTTTDATAALQVAGAVGLGNYVSGTATNGPITVRFDDFSVKPSA